MSASIDREANRLFGTDGVRGVANVEPVTAETALKLGRAAAHWFRKSNGSREEGRHRIIIGKDTRLSGYMLENAMVAGITSMGVDTLLVGPLPTPGVAYMTRSLRCDAGIVLTASHNPYEDNGIKFFRHDGYKLDDRVETEIEELVFTGKIDSIRPTATEIGKAARVDDALGRYIEYVKSSVPRQMNLEGLRVVVDVANGATYKSTPCILRELGAEVIVLHNTPDGTNINRECGSTYPDVIAGAVHQYRADVGIAHDGDGDRVILADEHGRIVNGDTILAITALAALQAGHLRHNTLVATVMSNLALDHVIQRAGGSVVRTAVGDRYVLEKLLEIDGNIGGEQSGHMIFRDFATTGDGIVSALQVLKIMVDSGRRLGDLATCLKPYPQALKNLKVKAKPPLENMPEVMDLVRSAEREMGDRGRVLLRYSGTEPKVRLLIEGENREQIEVHAMRIVEKLQETIGV
ncbi:MAG: phosphoglucosamine mutase [Verrucomicrobiae bacterium]|nr:phosphoglucosamine mutase [Verrucomicrobiae bacterium]